MFTTTWTKIHYVAIILFQCSYNTIINAMLNKSCVVSFTVMSNHINFLENTGNGFMRSEALGLIWQSPNLEKSPPIKSHITGKLLQRKVHKIGSIDIPVGPQQRCCQEPNSSSVHNVARFISLVYRKGRILKRFCFKNHKHSTVCLTELNGNDTICDCRRHGLQKIYYSDFTTIQPSWKVVQVGCIQFILEAIVSGLLSMS